VWRLARDRVVVRRVSTDDSAELAGLAALVWVAAERPSTVTELTRDLDAGEPAVAEAVSMLLSAGWLNQVRS
jgi:hypothetical protein